MAIPFRQQCSITRYIIGQRLRRRERYPLVLMLEPLLCCNLSCAGCGKIRHPPQVLERRLTAAECLAAAEECGAPVVSVTGGEPLLHEDLPQIVAGLIRQKRCVYLCTNGLLLKSRLRDYEPSRHLTVSLHLDGMRERHDALAGRKGLFDAVAEAAQALRARGFRFTVNCTLYEGTTAEEAAALFDLVMAWGAEGITASPGFSYSHAPCPDLFLKRERSRMLFREILQAGRRRRWRFNQSSLFLDFLAGGRRYPCTPWGNPTRTVFGWQKPCYLLEEGGYAESFRALLEETDWDRYGPGRHPRCADCMLHSGYEATAVNDALAHPWRALSVRLRGPGSSSSFRR